MTALVDEGRPTFPGCYSIALLSYISVRVVCEYKKPKDVQEAEERLLKRLRQAHQQNPFIAVTRLIGHDMLICVNPERLELLLDFNFI